MGLYEVPVSVFLLYCSVMDMLVLCCVFNSVCELFGETICNVFGCCCYFVVECYGNV